MVKINRDLVIYIFIYIKCTTLVQCGIKLFSLKNSFNELFLMHVNKPEPEHNQKAISGKIYTKREYIYEVNFIRVKRNYRRNATK